MVPWYSVASERRCCTKSMHHAPSVSCPVGRSSWLKWFGVALALWALVSQAAWWFSEEVSTGPFHLRWWLVAAFWVVSLGLLFRHWTTSPCGRIAWSAAVTHVDADRGAWSWSSAAYPLPMQAKRLSVAWAVGPVRLICLENAEGAVLWAWTDQSQAGNAWLPLQRALRAHAPWPSAKR